MSMYCKVQNVWRDHYGSSPEVMCLISHCRPKATSENLSTGLRKVGKPHRWVRVAKQLSLQTCRKARRRSQLLAMSASMTRTLARKSRSTTSISTAHYVSSLTRTQARKSRGTTCISIARHVVYYLRKPGRNERKAVVINFVGCIVLRVIVRVSIRSGVRHHEAGVSYSPEA